MSKGLLSCILQAAEIVRPRLPWNTVTSSMGEAGRLNPMYCCAVRSPFAKSEACQLTRTIADPDGLLFASRAAA